MMTRAAILAALVGFGCDDPTGRDGDPVMSVPADSGLRREDAGRVVPRPDSGLIALDAGIVVPADAGADGGCVCPPVPPCMAGTCGGDGACVLAALADGTACGELSELVCVSGLCVMPGCGNGLREGAELCDDGNLLDGDACSSTCEPLAAVIRSVEDPDWEIASDAGGHRVASDLLGRLLFTWVEQDIEGDAKLMGQRANRGGAAEGEALDLAPMTSTLESTVCGIGESEGWATAWAAPVGIDLRIVAPDGTLAFTRRASEAFPGAISYGEPMLAELRSGFVLVWTAFSNPAARSPADVLARVFDSSGSPVGGEITIATMTRDIQDHPSVAANGDQWMVAWVDRRILLGSVDRVFARRFEGTTALDGGQFEVSIEEAGPPAVAVVGPGSFGVAWTSDADIYYRVVDAGETVSMGDIEQLTMTPGREADLTAANVGGSDVLVAFNTATGSSGGFAMPMGTLVASRVMEALPMRLRTSDGQAAVSPVRGGAWMTWVDSESTTRGDFLTMFVPSRAP
jgi:cysteine-rich repeat protein